MHFQGEFTKKVNIWLQMLPAKTSKRLQEQYQETSYAQAQLQDTSIQIELQRNMFEVEHLIYNQWCSQYKSDTDS